MLQLHIKYLLSRFNIITILVVISLFIGSLFINLSSIPLNLSAKLSREIYFYNLVTLLKLVIVLLIAFLFSLAALPNNDNYQLYLLNKRNDRIKYYVYKIFSLVIITFIIILILISCFVLVGLIFTDWYIVEVEHIKFFGYLFIVSIMYGLLSYNLVKLLKSLIIVLIPCLILILEEAFISEKIIDYLSYIFPIIENNNGIFLSYGVIHVIILSSCYFILGLIKNYIVDIK